MKRRSFLKNTLTTAVGAFVFPTIIPAHVIGKNPPSDRINIGQIGCGVFHQTSGEQIGTISQLPVQHSSVKKVYDGTVNKIRAWISDIALDKNKPVLVYMRYPKETDHRYHFAR